jgi:hypothetical protein
MNGREDFEYLSLLKDDYFEKWKLMYDAYKSDLSVPSNVQTIGYTPHDFDHHIKSLYEIFENGLLTNADLNDLEIFCLYTATLFHDIGMHINSDERHRHSLIGQNWFMDKYNIQDSPVHRCIKHTRMAAIISDIIFAHADIKNDKNDEIVERTFSVVLEKHINHPTFNRTEVRVGLLAALLRLADELDIQESRVKLIDFLTRNINPESFRHWERCLLYSTPEIDNSSGAINLMVNDSKLENLEDTHTREELEEVLNNVIGKIGGEFRELFGKVFSNNHYVGRSWTLKKVVHFSGLPSNGWGFLTEFDLSVPSTPSTPIKQLQAKLPIAAPKDENTKIFVKHRFSRRV